VLPVRSGNAEIRWALVGDRIARKVDHQPTRTTGAPAGHATRDLPLLKSLKIATVAPTPLAIWRVR
jgi:hypothetical protein